MIVLLTSLNYGIKNRRSFSSLIQKNYSRREILSPIIEISLKEILLNQIKSLDQDLAGEISEEDNFFAVVLSRGTKIFFPKKENLEFELASLQLILGNIKIEGKWPRIIDLRFSKPIIKF